jgi:predicted AlkP superfamily phosphohydrolase/phosphomutase/tetratricopeptide (TPR) repeat protein
MRRGLLRGAAIAAAVLLAAGLCLVRVPPDGVGIVAWRGGGTPSLLAPGLSVRIPFLQNVDVYAGGSVEVAGTLAVASREGSTVSLPYAAAVRPGPQTLLALHQEGGSGGARAGLATLVEDQLRRAAAAQGTYDLASGAALRDTGAAARRELEKKFTAGLSLTLSQPIVPAELRATFDREAIYGRRQVTGVRILLVGLDGADWDVIDPMIARGDLPRLARLKREGAWARLRSNVPTLSPILWTTVATGKTPDRHGINDFLVADPRTGRKVPINSTFRTAKALWNILSDGGMPCDVVAWWASWPAEAIAGHLVSDRVAYSTFKFTETQDSRGAVYPPEYAATVERLRVAEQSITYAQVARFLHVDASEFRRARAAAARKEEPQEADESINVFARVLASTETYRKVALDLLGRARPAGSPAQLVAVYFQGVDEVNHRFAHCSPPRGPLCSPADYARFRDAVAAFYRYQDGILGEILDEARGATVLVVSDHGFSSGDSRPKSTKPFIEGGNPGLWHDLFGIFIAAGPPIRRAEIPTVTLYDIAPTILHLLGLPVPDDMPGKVLDGALTDEFSGAHPIARIPSYEGLQPAAGDAVAGGRPAGGGSPVGSGEALDSAADEEIVAQLRSLGYVGGARDASSALPPAADPQAPAEGGIPTILYHNNLARVYLGKRQYDLAEAEYRKALRIDPRSVQALGGLTVLYQARGEPEKALETVRTILKVDSGKDGAPLAKMAELFIQLGRAEDGIAFLRGVAPPKPGEKSWEVSRLVAEGMCQAAAGRPREAEAVYVKALARDPASLPAMQELFGLYDAEGRAQDLEPRLREALARDPGSAMHHNWLGLVLKRRGDARGAEAEFRRTLDASPDLVGATANLGSLYLQQGRAGEAVTILRQALEKDPRNIESRTNLIVALGMTHDVPAATGELEKARAMGQRVPLLYNALAYALYLNGQGDRALTTLAESLKIDPRQPDALRLKAEIEQGQPAAGSPYR